VIAHQNRYALLDGVEPNARVPGQSHPGFEASQRGFEGQVSALKLCNYALKFGEQSVEALRSDRFTSGLVLMP
jgi:hypothetical protein